MKLHYIVLFLIALALTPLTLRAQAQTSLQIEGNHQVSLSYEYTYRVKGGVKPEHSYAWEVNEGYIAKKAADHSQITVYWRSNADGGQVILTETAPNQPPNTVTQNIAFIPTSGIALHDEKLRRDYCSNASPIALTDLLTDTLKQMNKGRFVLLGFGQVNEFYVADTLNFEALYAAYPSSSYELYYEYTDAKNDLYRTQNLHFWLDPAPIINTVYIHQSANKAQVLFEATGSLDKSKQRWLWQWVHNNDKMLSIDSAGKVKLAHSQPDTLAYTLQLEENDWGCITSFGGKFLLDFKAKNKVTKQPTQFTDAMYIEGGNIEGWHWDFGDGHSATEPNPRHIYQSAGVYTVTLSVRQGIINYSLSKQIHVFDLVEVSPQTPYKANFDGQTSQWVAHGLPSNSWQRQALNHHQHIKGGLGKVWVTRHPQPQSMSTNLYNNGEQSYVESPFFDISKLSAPMVKLRYWADLDAGADGVVLLYTIDEGNSWHCLGNMGEGVHWYNQARILGQPGNSSGDQSNYNSQGWSGNSQTTDSLGWQVARLSLESVKLQMIQANANKVRFRMAFGSSIDIPINGYYEGFAFDDFEVLNQNRQVLWEYFGNQSMPTASQTAQKLAQASPHAISIHYHLGFPAKDAINAQNSRDNSGRAFYYGIKEASRMAVDGQMPDTADWQDSTAQRYRQRVLLNAPFDIQIAPIVAQGSRLSVSATIKALEAFGSRVVIQVAVIDTQVTVGNTVFYNAMRKMLPDAAGTFRAQAWAKDESQTLEFEWDYGSLDPRGFKVVVFVQDYATQEVYQAQISRSAVNQRPQDNQVTTGIEVPVGVSPLRLHLFPNPAHQFLRVRLPSKPLWGNTLSWEVMNLQGQRLKVGKALYKAPAPLYIHLGGLATGVYLLRVLDGRQVYSSKFEKK